MTASPLRLIKHAHACVELQRDEQRMLVDPGDLGEAPDLAGCTAVLVSHGHFDHAGRRFLEQAVAGGVPVFGPSDLGTVVGSEPLAAGLTVLHPGERRTIGGVEVEVVGGRPRTATGPRPAPRTGLIGAAPVPVI